MSDSHLLTAGSPRAAHRPVWVALAVLAGWVVVGKGLLPRVIPPLRVNDNWTEFSNVLIFLMLGAALALLLRARPGLVRREWFLPPATPGALGAIRVLVGVILLGSAIWEDLASTSLLLPGMRKEMGLVDALYLLPGFESLLSSHAGLRALETGTIIALVLATLGLFTRVTVPLATALYFAEVGIIRHYVWFYHTGLVPLYVLVVLSFTPCGDGWSIDRLLRRWRGRPVPDRDATAPIYTWARYACWIVVAVPYTMAGASKFRVGGWMWWEPTNLRGILYTDSLNPMEFDLGYGTRFIGAPDAFFAFLGLAGVLGELLFGLVLISRTARWVFPPMMALMHVGILFLQNILFPDLIPIQLIFYDWRRILAAIGLARPVKPTSTALDVAPPDAARSGATDASPTDSPGVLDDVTDRRSRDRSRAGQGANPPDPAHVGPWPRPIVGMLVVLLVVWVGKIEFFPLTSMRMYSGNPAVGPGEKGVIEYYRLTETLADGRTARAYPEDHIGAMHNARYRRVLKRTFDEKRVKESRPLTIEFLTRYAALRNAAARDDRDCVTAVAVERWQWDFKRDPTNPSRGERVDRFEVDVTAKQLTSR